MSLVVCFSDLFFGNDKFPTENHKTKVVGAVVSDRVHALNL